MAAVPSAPTVAAMRARRPLALALVLVVALATGASLAVAAPAMASLAGEVSAGQAVAVQLQRGAVGCDGLSEVQLERLGEYVMDRMVGSRAAHEAMNGRMTQALGAENADRMHQQMGRAFAGCRTGGTAMMGGGLSMMSGSAGWGWMRDGAWRRMSQGQWRDQARTMMGSRYVMPGHHRWSTTAALVTAAGIALLVGLLALALTRRSGRGTLRAGP